MLSDNGVFISYRRGTGSEVARIMQEFLEGQGFDVFLDVDSLGAGHFDEQLLREIESRRSFVLICSPGCLDRCVNEGDWVRRELEYAIKARRHIVPVIMPQFVWPSTKTMPPVVGELQRHNAFEYSHSHWALTKQKLSRMLRGERQVRTPAPVAIKAASGVLRLAAWCVVICGLPLLGVTLRWIGWDEASPSPSVTTETPTLVVGGVSPEPSDLGEPIPPRRTIADTAPPIESTASRTDWNANWDAEVLRQDPDPAVVTDEAARSRIINTKLPWKVRDRKTGIVMLLCPPGEFMMGSPRSELGRSRDETQHRRSMGKPFYLGETEVTQEQWGRVMGTNPSSFWGESNPVETVSWDDCRRFCELTQLRLPTEAEWEYACRGGTTGPYAGPIDEMAWHLMNSGKQSHPVRLQRANGWGLFDMHGNVQEWCEDVFGAYPEGAATQGAARGAEGAGRVLRGGAWYVASSSCRAARRDSRAPGDRFSGYGLRAARSAE